MENPADRFNHNSRGNSAAKAQYKTVSALTKGYVDPALNTSMSKQTPSHYDFSNGLPECLRTNRKMPFGIRPQPLLPQPDSMSKNSLTELQLAMNNTSSMLDFSETSKRAIEEVQAKSTSAPDSDKHRVFLHDFIEKVKEGSDQTELSSVSRIQDDNDT